MSVREHYQTKLALGSDTTLVIATDQSSDFADEVFRQLWLTIFQFERRFSRFIPASELSIFNKRAGIKTPISPQFKDLLLASKHLSIITEGLYNPFILPALQRAGYKKSFVKSYGDDDADDYSGRSVADPSKLVVNGSTAEIPYGTALDVGGCGKGYLADRLAELPIVQELHGYWFSLGGDITGKGVDASGNPWTVTIQDANDPSERVSEQIRTTGDAFAVATSGTTVRRGRTAGQSWHHIIDPRSKRPAQTDILLATVVAENAVTADVLASCAAILGSDHAPKFLAAHHIDTYALQTDTSIVTQGLYAQQGATA